MPGITYHQLGADRKLNEIVIAGSHDAGITGGGKNERTQNKNILEQAKAGIRFFDMRVAGHVVRGANGKEMRLETFHADPMVQRNAKGRFQPADLPLPAQKAKVMSLPVGGTWGEGLREMLAQAKAFVTNPTSSSEFLIFKFDKSANWEMIAEVCVLELGDQIYAQRGNLNTTRIGDLAGKVVILFPSSGITAIAKIDQRVSQKILGWQNLSSQGSSYEPTFKGLQYFGKGGTNPFSGGDHASKVKQNEKKQGSLMEKATSERKYYTSRFNKLMGNYRVDPPVPPDTMGMMYWTSTGITESIQKRNDAMWTNPNVNRMKKLWAQGMEEYYMGTQHHDTMKLPLSDRAKSAQQGADRKKFMPNIVMVDFADQDKCKLIYDLNHMSAWDLAQLA
jgi:hypothetical protein